VQLATEALKDIIPSNRPKEITVKGIQQFISKKYNITVEEILSKKRTKTIAYLRQVAKYLAREKIDISLRKLGEEFSGCDPTTVIHGHKKIVTEMNKDQNVASEMATFKDEIKNSI